jgi:hypothetical protein
VRLALSVAALALGAATLGAQGGPPDSAQAAAAAARPPVRDSVKAPFAAADGDVVGAHGRTWRWRGDQIFQTGATSLAELLETIPGVRVMRSGFLMSPHAIAWLGDPGRVRVFIDGVELDALDPRAGSAQDIGAIPLWNLDDVRVEATPGEVRVHLQTWRVERTTAATRVDVLTGDAETNLYRGFFARRFQSGLGLQFGFQQFSQAIRDRGGDGDGLSMFARVGVARERWSFDAVGQRDGRTRNATLREDAPGSVPAFTGALSSSYLRLAIGSPDRSAAWAQVIAAGLSFSEETPSSQLSGDFGTVPVDTVDTNAFRAQYTAAAGVRRGPASASAAARYRRIAGEGVFSPSLRLRFEGARFAVRAFAERAGEDSVMRTDVSVHASPLGWLTLTAAASRRSPMDDHPDPGATIFRAEALLRVRGAELTAGIVSRDSARTPALPIFARGITAAAASEASGLAYGLRLPVYKALIADVLGMRWESVDLYRPKDEVRIRLGLDTEWRSRFPRGDFTVRASGTMVNYSRWLVPLDDGPVSVAGTRVYSTLLEVRIKTATIFWEFRNPAGARYETVPGYLMPRLMNLYGVRWRFTN